VAINALLMKEDGEYLFGICKSLFQCRNVCPEKEHLWKEKLYV